MVSLLDYLKRPNGPSGNNQLVQLIAQQQAQQSQSPLNDYTASGIYDPARQFRGPGVGSVNNDPMRYSDPTNMPDPMIEALKWLFGQSQSK